LTTHSSESDYSSSGSSSDDEGFAESYDAVTQQGVIGRKRSANANNNSNDALSARIRDFATRLLRSKGESQMIAEKRSGVVGGGDGDEDEAPVLRPGKVRYSFSS
jgi:hypothetical protein